MNGEISSNLYRLDETLTNLVSGIPPVAKRKLMRKIAAYLRTTNRANISAQQAANGEKWQARKDKKNRRKMLTGFKRFIKTSHNTETAVIGFFGGSQLANIHHGGKKEKGIKYPERSLIGWTAENHRVIKIMILETIEETNNYQ